MTLMARTAPPRRVAYGDSPPLLLPRGLILLACVWLIGSWLLSIGVKPPIEPSSASYTPGVRLMLVCIGIGLMIGWPLLRLSWAGGEPTAHPIVQTVLDLIVLVSLIQVVIWPLRLVTPWTVARTAALDATLVGWTVLGGAVVASAIGSHRGGVRNLAIAACLAMCLLGPTLAVIGAIVGGSAGQLMDIGPLVAVYRLAQGAAAPVTGPQWTMIVMPAAAAALAWTALGVVYWARRASPQPAEPRTNVD